MQSVRCMGEPHSAGRNRHAYGTEKRQALERWASHLRELQALGVARRDGATPAPADDIAPRSSRERQGSRELPST
jgi:hypothetical protein